MAKKCPKKDFERFWYPRESLESECVEENNLQKNHLTKYKKSTSPKKIPTKSSRGLKNKTSGPSSLLCNQFIDNKNSNDNIEKVKSFQDATESKQTPLKLNNTLPLDLPDINLSLGDICDVSSTQMKKEIDEIFLDIEDCGSITMAHDLSQVIQYLPQEICYVEMKLIDEEDNSVDEIQQDPLLINNKNTDNHIEDANVKSVERERSPIKEKSNEIKEVKNIDNHIEDTNVKSIERERSPIKEKSNETQVKVKKRSTKSSGKNSKRKSKNRKRKRALETQLESDDDESLTKSSIMKLRLCKVKLQHVVPPQHKIEHMAGSRQLTKEEIEEFEKYGPLKKGHFIKSEDECIKKNWENFCKIHNWNKENVKPFLFMRHKNGFYIPNINERQNFVRFLANGLPWRSLYSVNFRFRNLYTNRKVRGKYTYEEDKIIMKYMMNASKSKLHYYCAKVAKILNRKRLSVWQHFEVLRRKHDLPLNEKNSMKYKSVIERQNQSNDQKKKKNKQKKQSIPMPSLNKSIDKTIYSIVNWTAPLIKRFIDELIEITKCKQVADLENLLISQETWKELENRTRISCDCLEKFWNFQLHMQLFSTKDIGFDILKVKLIKYLHEKKLQFLENIKWEMVQIGFPGATIIFLSELFERLTEHAKNQIDSSEFSDIIEYLYKNHIPEIENKPTDMVLQHLIYENGRLVLGNSDSEIEPLYRTHNPFNEI